MANYPAMRTRKPQVRRKNSRAGVTNPVTEKVAEFAGRWRKARERSPYSLSGNSTFAATNKVNSTFPDPFSSL